MHTVLSIYENYGNKFSSNFQPQNVSVHIEGVDCVTVWLLRCYGSAKPWCLILMGLQEESLRIWRFWRIDPSDTKNQKLVNLLCIVGRHRIGLWSVEVNISGWYISKSRSKLLKLLSFFEERAVNTPQALQCVYRLHSCMSAGSVLLLESSACFAFVLKAIKDHRRPNHCSFTHASHFIWAQPCVPSRSLMKAGPNRSYSERCAQVGQCLLSPSPDLYQC